MIDFIFHNIKLIVVVLFVINLITFTLYGLDKSKAKRHVWRIPEATLIGFAFIYGSLGALLGMKVFHHKTKHMKFLILVPLFFVIQMISVLYIIL